MAAFKDKTGERHGRLIVTGVSRKRSVSGKLMWNCLCDCGKKTRVITAALRGDTGTKSCGCLKVNSLTGVNNYQAQRMLEKYGYWVSSTDSWYVRASQMWGRIRKEKIPTDFGSIAEISKFLQENTPKKCPVFGVPLSTGKGKTHRWSPSADRIDPRKGYTRKNIQIISQFANIMKQNATPKQLKQFAHWALHGGVK